MWLQRPDLEIQQPLWSWCHETSKHVEGKTWLLMIIVIIPWFSLNISLVYPPPSNTDKWRLRRISTRNVDSNPGGHCCWAGGRSNIYRRKQGSSKVALISALELWAALAHRENGGTLGMVLVPLITIVCICWVYHISVYPLLKGSLAESFTWVFFSRSFQETTKNIMETSSNPYLDVPGRKCWDQWLGSVGYDPNLSQNNPSRR